MKQNEIIVSRLPKEGLTLTLEGTAPWLLEIFRNIIPDHEVDFTSVKGSVFLENFEGQVQMNGHLRFNHSPLCDRCGQAFIKKEDVNLHNYLSPMIAEEGKSTAKNDPEEVELNFDDLDFTVYHNDKILLDEVINDAIAITLPYSYVCQKSCKGLCLICGTNLNTSTCSCQVTQTDPRWDALKTFQPQKK